MSTPGKGTRWGALFFYLSGIPGPAILAHCRAAASSVTGTLTALPPCPASRGLCHGRSFRHPNPSNRLPIPGTRHRKWPMATPAFPRKSDTGRAWTITVDCYHYSPPSGLSLRGMPYGRPSPINTSRLTGYFERRPTTSTASRSSAEERHRKMKRT